jgi:hypothetical protein
MKTFNDKNQMRQWESRKGLERLQRASRELLVVMKMFPNFDYGDGLTCQNVSNCTL